VMSSFSRAIERGKSLQDIFKDELPPVPPAGRSA
jgi:hypothetical protein